MTHLDTGTTGAKRQSWKATNPRELLKRIMEDHPKWDKDRVLQTFLTEVSDNRRYFETIVEYWFANNFHSLVERPSSPHRFRQAVTTATVDVRQKVEQQIEQKAEVMLLDMLMPNGKMLRDCTGAECSKLSTKIGGWLLRIAKRIKPTQTVGSALNEAQARELYAKS